MSKSRRITPKKRGVGSLSKANKAKYQSLFNSLRAQMCAYIPEEEGGITTAANWIADAAGLHVNTVRAILYGETTSPHFVTVFKLCVALERVDELVAIFERRTNRPLTPAEFKKRYAHLRKGKAAKKRR